MRVWIIAALLLAVALSGCASEETPEGVDGTAQDDVIDADGGNETAEGGGSNGSAGNATDDGADGADQTNEVPIVTFTADIVNGTAPLLVNFTLDVQDDADSLAWTFTIDGNETLTGTEVPAAFNHTFDVGAFNVSIQVTDGEHTVDDTLSIQAVEGVPEPVLEEFSCTTTLGLGGPTITGTVNFGGCQLTTIDAPRIAHSVDDPDGCTTQFNADGDNTRDGVVQIGTEYAPGTAFTAVCDAGVTDVETTLVLEVPQE